MTHDLDITRKRLAMRSMRRGIKEMDLILSAFAKARLAEYDAEDLRTYEDLMEESDLDIYRWVSGQAEAPARFAPMVADISVLAEGLTRPRGD
ncbi:hypothetical protein AN189_13610 [Loktanella sp. 3ANDIMAR09]|uniref:succinate dehydrogenase assembly factor 2 n=1 Tax=Loktanella sp. 3ANDIMAR09 TaxID=1225657 RepID=UPI0006F1EEF4|nr:succinate dehydrogenase assembly factor 2 [Loktanella sp. 3ANDIMAR09]KQI67816.1 hypothetical protein AN189_13610 [Loktanella sp. 3ANDIMAR09]